MSAWQYAELVKFLRETGRHALVVSWLPFLVVIR